MAARITSRLFERIRREEACPEVDRSVVDQQVDILISACSGGHSMGLCYVQHDRFDAVKSDDPGFSRRGINFAGADSDQFLCECRQIHGLRLLRMHLSYEFSREFFL